MTATQELEVREKQEVARESTRPGPVFRPDIDILEGRDEYKAYCETSDRC